MSDPGPSRGSTLSEIARLVLGGMPPGLVIIVIMFGGLIWFLDAENAHRAERMSQRTELVAKLLERCLSARFEKAEP